jgi:hypothetical protein
MVEGGDWTIHMETLENSDDTQLWAMMPPSNGMSDYGVELTRNRQCCVLGSIPLNMGRKQFASIMFGLSCLFHVHN